MALHTKGSLTGFSRLSKGLSGVLFLGYLVTLIFPWTINYLALVPGKTIPFSWNIFTAGYMEQSIFGLILSIFGLLFCGKLLEPVWTSKEFLKFIIFVNMTTLGGVYVTAITSYYISRREAFLYMQLSGFHGVLSGFLVGAKLTVPDQDIMVLGSFHLRAEWLPSLVVLMSIGLSLITSEAIWFYLRYLQRNHERNFTGNPDDKFAFSTFFPHFMRPTIDVLASSLYKLLCEKHRRVDAHLSDSFSVDGFDTAESSRWRERGARTLDERLQISRSDDTQEDHTSSAV